MMSHHIIVYCDERDVTLTPSLGYDSESDQGWSFSRDTHVQTIDGSFMKVADIWSEVIYLKDELPQDEVSRRFWKLLMPLENITCAIWNDDCYDSWTAKKLWDLQERGFIVKGDLKEDCGTDLCYSKVRSTLMTLEYCKEVRDLLHLVFCCDIIPDIVLYGLLNHPRINEPMSIISRIPRSLPEEKKGNI